MMRGRRWKAERKEVEKRRERVGMRENVGGCKLEVQGLQVR